MKKLLFIGMILMSFLIACGSSSNENGEEYGGGSCNVKKSYGSTSFTRDENSVFDDCVRESKNSFHYCYFDPNELLPKLQKTTIVFEKKCRENRELIQCPDFIPDSITLSRISGCDIYYVYGEVDCYAECPDFYFPTDNETFKTVSFHPHEGYISSSVSALAYAEIYSYNAEKGLSFSIDTGENTATFKSEDSSITVHFQILIDGVVEIEGFLPCEDSSGRKYNEGDKISSECRAAYCSDGDWVEDEVTCYGCHGQEIGDIMKWNCADGVNEIDWCKCFEDEEYGSIWRCRERIDLACPQ